MNEQKINEQLIQEILGNPFDCDLYLVAFSERIGIVPDQRIEIGHDRREKPHITGNTPDDILMAKITKIKEVFLLGNFKLVMSLLRKVRTKRALRYYEERLARNIEAFGIESIILDSGDIYFNYRVWYKIPRPIEYSIGGEVFKGLIHVEDEDRQWCIFENPTRLQELIEKEERKEDWDPPIEPHSLKDSLMNWNDYYSVKKPKEDLDDDDDEVENDS